MSTPQTIIYQIHQEEFTFLGIENILSESSDFGYFWNHFFSAGGYEKIIPYAIDTKPLNIWYTNSDGQDIYFQGLMVENVNTVPDEYKLVKFPASDFMVVTHDWVPTNDEALRYGIDAGWKNIKNLQIPDGYIRYDGKDCPITLIEKENMDTPDGSRYEMWVPIKK